MKITKLVLQKQQRNDDLIFLFNVIAKKSGVSNCSNISLLFVGKKDDDKSTEVTEHAKASGDTDVAESTGASEDTADLLEKLKKEKDELKIIKHVQDISELKKSDFMNDYLFIYFSDCYKFPVRFSVKLEQMIRTSDVLCDCNVVLVCQTAQKKHLKKYDFFHL